MKQDVTLYISDKKVDFSNDLNLSFTYQFKDINNPSIVKNPFTKTIQIIGTKNNNNIFGEIYNLDREQVFNADKLVGAHFNPSIRTPFSIYRNGEIIETGYMQLNSISIKDKQIVYNATLYGGIGNFFYSLMYNDDNESLTLADLDFGVVGDDGNKIGKETEFDFTINKDFVKKCWDEMDVNGNRIHNYITFVPSYNGLPENFDADKVLIDTFNNPLFEGTRAHTKDGVNYTTFNHYVLATLPKPLTEWEVKDLRSYLQRPALKVSKMLEAIANPINNGGYTVEFDSDFFNDKNPYYKDAYIALPLLGNIEHSKMNASAQSDCGLYYNDGLLLGGLNTIRKKEDYLIPIDTENFTVIGNGIDYSNFNVGTTTDISIDFGIDFVPIDTPEKTTLDCYIQDINYNDWASSRVVKRTILAQVLIFNGDEYKMCSDIYSFTGKAYSTIDYTVNNENWRSYWDYYQSCNGLYKENIKTINGEFREYPSINNSNFYFYGDKKTSFNITLTNIPHTKNLRVMLRLQSVGSADGSIPANSLIQYKYYQNTGVSEYKPIRGNFVFNVISAKIKRNDTLDLGVVTNTLVTKKQFLKTEKSPADYLLSYTKLFNLMYTIDETTKTVKIQTMNNYFTGDIVNWSDRIDYGKDINIKPLMFDKKFYQMKLEGDNHYFGKYKNEYDIEYGQKRINTNYNFNNETEDLLNGNIYQNGINVLDTSVYYNTFYTGTIERNSFSAKPFEYKLYNRETDELRDVTIEHTTLLTRAVAWNGNSGYDTFDKPCFFTMNGEEKTLADSSNVLLFYDGKVTPKSIDNVQINHILTDDVSEMYKLNDGRPCYINTNPNYTSEFKYFTKLTEIPHFSRYKVEANQVKKSWDFGVPKETYIPNLSYDDERTIYKQFWDKYYSDQLDINTKEITCYVNLDGLVVNGELLRKFYYFNGCYWLLNKIDNYNINKNESTKCTFIKINDLSNYHTENRNYGYAYSAANYSENDVMSIVDEILNEQIPMVE